MEWIFFFLVVALSKFAKFTAFCGLVSVKAIVYLGKEAFQETDLDLIRDVTLRDK